MYTAKERLPQVNYLKSIATNRLIYKFSFNTVFNYFTNFILIVLIFFSFALALLSKSETFPVIQVLIVLGCIWMSANLLLLKAMVKVKGGSKEENLKCMIAALERYYTGLAFEQVQENVYQDLHPCGSFKNGWVITIILNQEDVYLNIYKLGRSDSRIPWAGLSCYLTAKKVAKSFLLEQIDYTKPRL